MRMRRPVNRPRPPPTQRPGCRAWTVDSVNWARCADAAYHRELARALCGAAEADALALLVGAMLRVCSPSSPRTFRRGVLRVLLNARRSATTGHVTLTQRTPLDVLSSALRLLPPGPRGRAAAGRASARQSPSDAEVAVERVCLLDRIACPLYGVVRAERPPTPPERARDEPRDRVGTRLAPSAASPAHEPYRDARLVPMGCNRPRSPPAPWRWARGWRAPPRQPRASGSVRRVGSVRACT